MRRNALLLLALTLFCAGLAPREARAQVSSSDLRLPDLLLSKPDLRAQAKTGVDLKGVAMDGPVDPNEYHVGPGDVIGVNIWSASPVEHQLTIGPEGVLLIPSVGAIDLRGKTLKQAKDDIASATTKKYPKAEISVTLLSPRKVSVQISGMVINEGMFELYSVQRVDQLIEEANKLPSTAITKKFYDVDLQWQRRNATQRYITVRRRDGTVIRADLVCYYLHGDGRWNPYLMEGDKVFLAPRTDEDNRIGVFGGVLRNGSVEYVRGDSLTDLIALGLDFKPNARTDAAILTRLSPDGNHMDSMGVDLLAIRDGRAPNVALNPGDRLVVPEERDPRTGNACSVDGEVVHPGTYPITRSTTRLSDVIRAAGGITPGANLKAAVLLRARISPLELPEEYDQERMRSMRTALGGEDSVYYLTETALRLKGEVVTVDFGKLLVEGDSTQDVIIRNYDRIIIPSRTKTIYVFGQVIRPGHIEYSENASLGYYIDKAGGYTAEAREGDVMVIKAGSRVWLAPDETTIEDGDYIWVPKEVHYPFGYYLTTVAQFATVLAALASVIIVAQTLK